MIASYFPVSASVRACDGISNAPGTRDTAISSSRQPLRRSASSAPCKRRSVMNEFQRLTTTAKRLPRASRSPSAASWWGRFFCQKRIFTPLPGSATKKREFQFVCWTSVLILIFSWVRTWRTESRSVTSIQISAWIVSSPSTISIWPSGTLNGIPWPRAVFHGVPRSKPSASNSLLSALNSLAPAACRIVVMPLITISLYRSRRLGRRRVFPQKLLRHFQILFRYLQPYSANHVRGQRMHTVHLLIAQKTVYATGFQQPHRDIGFVDIVKGGNGGQLVRVPMRIHLFTLEVGGALFQKGRRAFFLVFGGAADTEQRGFQEQSLRQRHVHALVHCFHAVLDRQRRHADDFLRDFLGPRHQPVCRHNFIHQPHAMGFLRGNHLARQQDLHRQTSADQARQALRAAIAGNDAQFNLRLPELGIFARQAHGASHGDLTSAAQRKAVHTGNHRLAQVLDQIKRCLAFVGVSLGLHRVIFCQLIDVCASDKGLLAAAR